MELMEHSCKLCGGILKPIEEGKWKCPYCASIYEDDIAVQNTRTMREILDDAKCEKVRNLRRNLYDATNAEYISSTDVKNACVEIRKYLPDDFAATVYELASGQNAKATAKFLRDVDVQEHLDEIEGVIKFLIKSLHKEFCLELNNLITRAYSNNYEKLSKYQTLVSEESQKLDRAIYQTNHPREVFVAYSSKDMKKVSELVEVLESQGFQCFVAARNLRHGSGAVENYDEELKRAMDHCKIFVFVSSLNSRAYGCDALDKEIPYIEECDRKNAPGEYRNKDYRAIPSKYKKPRVEYMIEKTPDRDFNVGDSTTDAFFDGLEWALSPKEVARRVHNILQDLRRDDVETPPASNSAAAPAAKKICVGCGAENDVARSICSACGGRQFVPTVAEYIKIKNQQTAPRTGSTSGSSAQGSRTTTNKKKSKAPVIAAVVAIAAIILIGIISGASRSSSQSDPWEEEYTKQYGEYNPGNDYEEPMPGDKESEQESTAQNGEYIGSYANIDYKITSDGVMTISGSGAMPDFGEYGAPWYNIEWSYEYDWMRDLRDFVHTVIISEGITAVGNHSFDGFRILTDVTLAPSVTRVGDYAFRGCEYMLDMDLQRVTDIGREAFYNCASLSTVTLSNSTVHIGLYAFHGTTVYNDGIINDGVLIIGNCLIGADVSTITSIDLSSVTCIADGALEDADQLVEIIWSEELKYIGNYAFADAGGLTEITIPANVLRLGEGAFERCLNLTKVNIPDGSKLTSIGSRTFAYCEKLTFVSLNNATSLGEIGGEAFFDCNSFVEIIIPSSIRKIGNNAYANCSNLMTLIVPVSVTEIGERAFASNDQLRSIIYLGSEYDWDLVVKGADWDIDTGTSIENGGCQLIFANGTFDPDKAEAYTPGLAFVLNEEKSAYSVVSYSGSDVAVVIPSTYCSLPVTRIEDCAFSYQSSIVSISIPASVTYIGREAFYDNNSLVSVNFAEGSMLETIGISCFSSCDNLLSINIPASLKELGSSAFWDCFAITEVLFESGCEITSIGEHTFYGCSALKTVNIPDSVTSIGEEAFRNCAIESLTFGPNSKLTSIGPSSFYNCEKLTTVTMYPLVENVGSYAFGYCENIMYLTSHAGSLGIFPNSKLLSVTVVCGDLVSDNALSGASNLQSVTIGDSVTQIGNYAFSGCTSLRTVSLGNNVVSIGQSAFYMCSSLNNVNLPDSVETLGHGAFAVCSSLTDIYLGNGLVTIDTGCFEGCGALKAITLPNTLKTIGEMAFNGAGLVEIVIPEGVTSLGYLTFAYCSDLTTVTLPKTLESTEHIFNDQTHVKNATFPIRLLWMFSSSDIENVVITEGGTIPNYSFQNFTKLQSVKLPDTEGLIIGAYAFSGCTSLMSITLPETLEDIASNAFYECKSLIEVINHTSMNIVAGDLNAYGGVGAYALTVHSGESLIRETEDGYVFITADDTHHMIAYRGTATDIVFPSSYEGESYVVRSGLFRENRSITSVTIEGVKDIPDYLFYKCYGIKSITIGAGVKTIGNYAFAACEACETISIGDDVISIGDYSFSEELSLKTLTLGSSLESIGNYAFYYCTGEFERVTIPASVKFIGSCAFLSCNRLSGIKFEDSGSMWDLYNSGGGYFVETIAVSSSTQNADNLREYKVYQEWKKVED